MQTSGAMRREKAKLHQAVIASAAKQSIYPTPRYGLLRFARNDEEKAAPDKRLVRRSSKSEGG